MQRKNQTTYLILDNEKTYYNPNEIDLPNSSYIACIDLNCNRDIVDLFVFLIVFDQ